MNDADTDDDFLNDGAEVAATTNPLDPDTDEDLIVDGRELVFGTNPKLADTDGDTLSDGFEIGFGRISVVSGSFTWAQAKADAESRGGHLLTITTALENTALLLVNPTIGSTSAWIGYTDQHVEGQFRWVTGESGTFTNFNTGEPNNEGNEDFVHFHSADAKWNDHNAARTSGYALETGFFTDPTLQDTDNDGTRDDVDTTVGTLNVAPIAGADSFLRNLGDSFSTSTSQLMANDFDPNGDVMAFVSFTQPASGGTLTSNAGVLSLATDPGFTGTISFTYTLQDPDGLTATGNVSVAFVNNTVPIAGFVRPVRASLSFDGSNDSATTPHYAAFDDIETAAGVTFESWMLTRSFTSNHAIPFDKHKVSVDFGWHWSIDRTGPGLTLHPSITGSVAANTIPALNSWTHLAVSLNQSTRETIFYVNGIEVRRATAPSALVDTGAGDPMYFGNSPSGGDEFTNGLLGEIRLWKRILSGDEIRSRMNVQSTGTEAGLAAAWSFDGGSGASVPNQVDGGLPAVFAGGAASPTWSTFAPPVNQHGQDETTQPATPVLIALQGSDADGHALTATITSMPARGQLFQFAGGDQGDAITAAGTAVTDVQRRVVYVPNAGVQGADRFAFTVTDTLATSLPALVNLTVNADSGARLQWVAGADFAAIERPNDADDTSNPNVLVPEWSYGQRSGVSGSAFTPLGAGQHSNGVGHADIDGYTSIDTHGSVLVNTGASSVVMNFGSGPLGALTPKSLWLHPGATGTVPVVRWTAPVAGTYAWSAAWQDIDPYGGDGISTHILVNGVSAFTQTLANAGGTTNSQTRDLKAGDVVDFVIGMNGSVGNDSTRFDVTIDRQVSVDVWSLAQGATVTYLAGRADFTVTAEAPAAHAPELAASYDDWIASVDQTWGDEGGAGAAAFPAPSAEGEGKSASPRLAWDADPMADPDGDGAVNLLEYAFQTNPLNPSSIARLESRLDSTRPGGLEIRHRMRATAVDVGYVIEHSADLTHWQVLDADVPGYQGATTQPVSTGTQMKNIRLDSASRAGPFFRVQVISTTP